MADANYHSAGSKIDGQYFITSRVLTHSGDRRFLRNKDDDDHDENDDDGPHWA